VQGATQGSMYLTLKGRHLSDGWMDGRMDGWGVGG